MLWTKRKPVKPGIYWAKIDDNHEPIILNFYKEDVKYGKCYTTQDEEPRYAVDFQYFAGPITPPIFDFV